MSSAIKLGSTAISNAKLGSTQVSKIYQGSNLIWQHSTGPSYPAGAYAIYDFGNASSYAGSGTTVYDVKANNVSIGVGNATKFNLIPTKQSLSGKTVEELLKKIH